MFWYSKSANSARCCLKPVVFMFAKLLAITSTLVCWANMPVEAMERARMIVSP